MLDTGAAAVSQVEQDRLGLDAAGHVDLAGVLVLGDGSNEDLAIAHDVRRIHRLVHPNDADRL